MLNKIDLDSFVETVSRQESFTLLGHSIPDGDSIGAVTAMTWVMRNLGKDVTAVFEDEIPAMYQFLNGIDNIRPVSDCPKLYDCLIYLDCANPERVGDKLGQLLPKTGTIINIDHHISNTRFGNVNVVDPNASSTCEIIFRLLKKMNLPLTVDIATPLYCGILMDTGSFKYSNTAPSTHRIAAELLEIGIDQDLVRTSLFESKTKVELALQKAALNSLEFCEDGRVAYMQLKYEDLYRLGAVNQHFEGTINLARNIENVELALLFREIEPGLVKVGFRSKQGPDVNLIAQNWGGGGHKRAAGAELQGDPENVKELVLLRIKEYL